MAKTATKSETLVAEDFAPTETTAALTAAQVRAIVNMTHYRATLMRYKGTWSPAEEEAFLNGAMSALLACRANHKIPVYWIFTGGKTRLLDKLLGWKNEGK